MMRPTSAVSAAFMIAVLLCGCGAPVEKGDNKPKVLFLVKTLSNPFFISMGEGAERAAVETGVELIFVAPQKETDIDQQVSILRDKLTQGVDAVCIAPAGSRELVYPLKEANRKNIPVFNIDNRLDPATLEQEGVKIAAYVGADNEEGGYLAGKYLAEALGGKGEVAMLEGIQGVDNAEARKRGFLKAVAGNPGIEVVATQSANWDMDQGDNVMADILRAHPELVGVFCANDMMALGAIRAIDRAGKTGKVLVASYDNLEAAQTAIKEGKMLCSIEQHPDLMGYEGVKQAAALIKGQKVPPETLVSLEVIDKVTLGGE